MTRPDRKETGNTHRPFTERRNLLKQACVHASLSVKYARRVFGEEHQTTKRGEELVSDIWQELKHFDLLLYGPQDWKAGMETKDPQEDVAELLEKALAELREQDVRDALSKELGRE